MKNMLPLFFAMLALHAPLAAADDVKCRTVYVHALKACARSPDLLALSGRAGAQKACVEGAAITRTYCMSESNACWENCQARYDRSTAACEADFAPAVCGGETMCESIILQQRDNCISHVVSGLDSCSDACP
jgi:hypothetical protein